MVSQKQKSAARKNIKKAQEKWRSMSSRQHSLAQPEGRSRAKPGAKGEGRYFRFIVRPKEEFITFRYHDVGQPGHLQRLAGRRTSGSWDDQAWLISKKDAHIEKGRLVADTEAARKILAIIGPAKQIKADLFKGHARKNVPEDKKPTLAQRRARKENIAKAPRRLVGVNDRLSFLDLFLRFSNFTITK